MELSRLDLHFAHTQVIKSKALADFIAEWTPTQGDEDEPASFLPEEADPRD